MQFISLINKADPELVPEDADFEIFIDACIGNATFRLEDSLSLNRIKRKKSRNERLHGGEFGASAYT